MRGHALHTFLVTLALPLRRRADLGAPSRDERATRPSSPPAGPAPIAEEAEAGERSSGGGGATVAVVTDAPPRRRSVPSGGYQVHNGRARRAVGD